MVYGLAGIGILLLAVSVSGIRLWKYRRQVAYLLSQIELLTQEDTNYRLSSYCRVGQTEALVNGLNHVLQLDRDRLLTLKKDNRNYKESVISISHDIRTPLTSAKGYIQMLLKDKKMEQEKQQAYLENVERRIDDVTDMLTQLFEYARIEADEFAFQEETLNPGNLFADVIAMFYEEFTDKGCEPVVSIEQKPHYIHADRQCLRRIMENLLKNALIHGTGEYLFAMTAKDGEIELTVSNRTDSIAQEDMEYIFDRFYTTDLSRTRKTTGLGLAIVRQFTQKMGGQAYAALSDGIFTVSVKFPEAS